MAPFRVLQSLVNRSLNGDIQAVLVTQLRDVDLEVFPPDHVHGVERCGELTPLRYFHYVDTSSTCLVWSVPLRVARIDRQSFGESVLPPCVDMAQSPIVDANSRQVVESAWGIRLVAGVRAHVGVKETNRDAARLELTLEVRDHVLPHLSGWITISVHYWRVWVTRSKFS